MRHLKSRPHAADGTWNVNVGRGKGTGLRARNPANYKGSRLSTPGAPLRPWRIASNLINNLGPSSI